MTFWYRAELHVAAKRHNLDPDLVRAVIQQESAGNTAAYRYEKGFWLKYMAAKPEWRTENPQRVSASYGLMQVMYSTARELGLPVADPPETLFLPAKGLEYGCRVLAERLAWAKGDVRKALAGYNGGKGNWTAPKPQEYADSVLKHLEDVRAGRLE